MYCPSDIGQNVLVYIKEFSILIFHRIELKFHPYFELHIALCSVLGLKEMSVNLTDNVLQTENHQYLFHFSYSAQPSI